MTPKTVDRDLKRIGIATTVLAIAYGLTAIMPVIAL